MLAAPRPLCRWLPGTSTKAQLGPARGIRHSPQLPDLQGSGAQLKGAQVLPAVQRRLDCKHRRAEGMAGRWFWRLLGGPPAPATGCPSCCLLLPRCSAPSRHCSAERSAAQHSREGARPPLYLSQRRGPGAPHQPCAAQQSSFPGRWCRPSAPAARGRDRGGGVAAGRFASYRRPVGRSRGEGRAGAGRTSYLRGPHFTSWQVAASSHSRRFSSAAAACSAAACSATARSAAACSAAARSAAVATARRSTRCSAATRSASTSNSSNHEGVWACTTAR